MRLEEHRSYCAKMVAFATAWAATCSTAWATTGTSFDSDCTAPFTEGSLGITVRVCPTPSVAIAFALATFKDSPWPFPYLQLDLPSIQSF